jgi:predicted DNA-binding transcriptional regulator YafY
VVAKGLTWYLVARGASGMRTYRVSRMAAVTVLASQFERPPGFDLAEYWKESTARLGEQRGNFAVTLRATPDAVRKLMEWGMVPPMGDGASSAEDAEGRATVTAHFDAEGEAMFFVLGLGTRVSVIAPAEFRERVAAEAGSIAGTAVAASPLRG